MSEQQVLPPLNLPPNKHGYPACDCDLGAGVETCTIQPPYLSGPERWKMALKQREDELITAIASLSQSEAERERLQGEVSVAIIQNKGGLDAALEDNHKLRRELARERELIQGLRRGIGNLRDATGIGPNSERLISEALALLEDKSKPVVTSTEEEK